jgi:D-3-phosphoglycerate dehydrogenase / 2-oxoglutarate reductase
MKSLKIALIDKTLEQIPAWVPEALGKAGHRFVCANCATSEDLLQLARDADIVWIYGGNQLASAENLPLLNCFAVIRSGSGVDRIDVEAATKLGMVVVNTPHAHHEAVSDHSIALMFAVGRRIAAQDRATRASGFAQQKGLLPLWRLSGKTIGLVGFGLIPRCLVKKLSGFEPRFLVYDPFVDRSEIADYHAESVTLEDLLKRSDIVSIHTPLTSATHHLIGERELSLMKKDAILINTARGPVINEEALLKALKEGWILGAGLDVFEVEPPKSDNPLMTLENAVLTPHVAGVSAESVDLTWRLSVEACLDLAAGYYPRSYVNRGVKARVPLRLKVREN